MPPPTEVVADADALARFAQQLTLRIGQPRPARYLLGIAGIGGSGKSTLAARLVAAIEPRRPGACRLLPMDGFHLPSAELDRRGLRHRKGAPETFDAESFLSLLRQARDPQAVVDFPVYDRALHEPVVPRDQHHRLDSRIRLVVIEGNYLLLNLPPWSRLPDLLDETWFLDTPLEQARQWIVDRHVRGGRPRKDAEAWYQSVDAANAQLVLQNRRPADLLVRWA